MSFQINSSFQITAFQLMPKAKDVTLEAINSFDFSCFEVTIDVCFINLINCQLAEIVFSLLNVVLTIIPIDIQETISL